MNDAIPLLICVTGHRETPNLERERIREAVQQVLRDLRRDCPHTPLAILSPLATGADELAAQAALELAEEMPVQLVAVLPWPQEIDEQLDLPDTTRWKSALRKQAVQTVQIPLPDDVTVDALQSNAELREARYDAVGRYIAQHGQILLAIWNGDRSTCSQTAKVIRYHSEGVLAPLGPRPSLLDPPELSAVYHIPVGTAGKTNAGRPTWIWPQVVEASVPRKRPKGLRGRLAAWMRRCLIGLHDAFHRIAHSHDRHTNIGERLLRQRWRAVDRYNRDLDRLLRRPTFAARVAQSRLCLIPEEDATGLPKEVLLMRQAFAVADATAGYWQERHRRVVLLLFVIALLAIGCLESYAHLFSTRPAWLATYILLLGCGYAVFRWTRWTGHQGRWLDARALAEALRVQVYWRWVGKLNCVADHYLRNFRSELDWIRHALRATYLMSGAHSVRPVRTLSEERIALQRVQQLWVVGQRDYFTSKAPESAELEVTFETAARVAFTLAVLTALCQLWYHVQHDHMSHELVLVTFGSLVTAALLEEFADIHAFSLLARRYSWMASLYETAELSLTQLLSSQEFDGETAKAALQLHFELGREALAENSDWVLQHRQRPPVLPAG